MTATGNNYSQALFMLAREENTVEEFYNGLKLVQGTLSENDEYLQFLQAPSIPKSQRTEALSEAFGGNVHKHVLSFLQLLCEHGKITQLTDCITEFERLREWSKNTVVATVKTAVELTDIQKVDLVAALEKRTGKNVTLQPVIDTAVLGGIVVEIDGELLDGSVKSNLKRVREVISV